MRQSSIRNTMENVMSVKRSIRESREHFRLLRAESLRAINEARELKKSMMVTRRNNTYCDDSTICSSTASEDDDSFEGSQ